MKLQVAIDRLTLKEAKKLIAELADDADIIEMGTSFCKDYGLDCVKEAKPFIKQAKLLIDIKTIDEGEYEFRRYFEEGADILTVMGASAKETIDVCNKVTGEYKKEMMIDLLECSDEKIQQISHYENAIYCIHFSSDAKEDYSVKQVIQRFKDKFPSIRRLAIAGGINKERVAELKHSGVELAVVGSDITKNERPGLRLRELLGVLN